MMHAAQPAGAQNPAFVQFVRGMRAQGASDEDIAGMLAQAAEAQGGGGSPIASPLQSPLAGPSGVMGAIMGGEAVPRTAQPTPRANYFGDTGHTRATGTPDAPAFEAIPPQSPMAPATNVAAPPPPMPLQNEAASAFAGRNIQENLARAGVAGGTPAVTAAAPTPEKTGRLGMTAGTGRNITEFGLALMTAGDRPGASLLGSIGAAGTSTLESRRDRRKEARLTKRENARDRRSEERLQIARDRAAKKTPARLVTLAMPDGEERSFRLDDPRLDRALTAGAVEVGSGGDGDLTISQERSNLEIDMAREILDGQNVGRDEIARRTAKATATGRENPDYDPTLDDLVRQAGQRKYGDDRQFNRIYRQLYGEPPPPIPEPRGGGYLDQMGQGPAAQPGGGGIEAMSANDLERLVGEAGDQLTPAELQRVESRLRVLGF